MCPSVWSCEKRNEILFQVQYNTIVDERKKERSRMLKKVAFASSDNRSTKNVFKDENSENSTTDGGFHEWTPLPLRRAETEPASLISPPTQVVFSEGRKSESPRPYFLRCPSRWSSTPLPSFPTSSSTCQTPEVLGEEGISNFQQRLLENLDETVEVETQSFSHSDTVHKDSGIGLGRSSVDRGLT